MRKTLKESRALARLFLPSLGEPARVTIAALAVVRRRIGRARDLDVMEGRLERLAPPPEIAGPLARGDRARARRRRARPHRFRRRRLARPARRHRQARSRAGSLARSRDADIAEAVARTYRQALRRGRLAFEGGDPAALHALRSRVVDLRYQLSALSPGLARGARRPVRGTERAARHARRLQRPRRARTLRGRARRAFARSACGLRRTARGEAEEAQPARRDRIRAPVRARRPTPSPRASPSISGIRSASSSAAGPGPKSGPPPSPRARRQPAPGWTGRAGLRNPRRALDLPVAVPDRILAAAPGDFARTFRLALSARRASASASARSPPAARPAPAESVRLPLRSGPKSVAALAVLSCAHPRDSSDLQREAFIDAPVRSAPNQVVRRVQRRYAPSNAAGGQSETPQTIVRRDANSLARRQAPLRSSTIVLDSHPADRRGGEEQISQHPFSWSTFLDVRARDVGTHHSPSRENPFGGLRCGAKIVY